MGQKIVEFFLSSFGEMGYSGIFFLMALESSVFPVPSEFVMIPAGILAAQGKMDPVLAVAAGTLGSLLGALANYWVLGRRLGRPFLEKYGKWILVTPEKYARAEALFLRNSNLYTFLGRLIPVVRHLISIPAGIFRMRTVPFLALTAAGAALWCAVLVWAGHAFGEPALAAIAKYSHEFTLAVEGLLVLAVSWWGWKIWKAFRK